MKLKNKVAIITGARGGIGLGIAEEIAKEGARVVIADINLKDCEKACKKLEKKYKGKTLAVKVDVSKKEEVEEMVKQTVKKWGRLDIMVNNAGIVKFIPITETSEEDWDLILKVNLKGVFLCSQAAAKQMIKQRRGKIISIASIAGLVGFENIGAYCASKGGIIALTKEMALELAKYNIKVNAIAPGVIKTKMTEAMLKDKKTRENLLAQTPMGRVGKPEEIGKAAVYLASDDSDFVTGHTLVVDGGWLSH